MGEEIRLSDKAKYLRVWLDTHGYFGPHVREIVSKAEKRVAALTKILPNIGRPNGQKREVLWGVVRSTILYASPIWKRALRVGSYAKMLEAIQRKMLLRVGCAYRTVSSRAIQVITGIPPIDLLVEESGNLWGNLETPNIRATERGRLMATWQERWEETRDVVQWTKRLIPNLDGWINCAHRKVSYFSAQFLSGHGAFRKYTKKIGKQVLDTCIYCGDQDTVEHTIFVCPRWDTIRRERWEDYYGNLIPENVIENMVRSKQAWDKIMSGIENLMKHKEAEEREFQGGGVVF